MTEQERHLLLIDLCARLPYKVKVEYNGKVYSLSRPYIDFMCIINGAGEEFPSVEKCKPYLRPMSSMTEEEKREYNLTKTLSIVDYPTLKSFDWLNSHHFDYRGLIPLGLGIDCTGLNIYENEKSI